MPIMEIGFVPGNAHTLYARSYKRNWLFQMNSPDIWSEKPMKMNEYTHNINEMVFKRTTHSIKLPIKVIDHNLPWKNCDACVFVTIFKWWSMIIESTTNRPLSVQVRPTQAAAWNGHFAHTHYTHCVCLYTHARPCNCSPNKNQLLSLNCAP